MTHDDTKIVQIVPAQPGWRVVYECEGRPFMVPVALWGLDDHGFAGPLVYSREGLACRFATEGPDCVGLLSPDDSPDTFDEMLADYLERKAERAKAKKDSDNP